MSHPTDGRVFSYGRTLGGSVTVPSIALASSSSSGLYDDAGKLAVTITGTKRAHWSSTEHYLSVPIQGSAGTAAAPAYSFSTDTNTGAYLSAADTYSISTGGTNRFSVSNSGVDVNSGVLTVPNGSLGAPSIRFAESSAHGLFSGSGQIVIVNNGSPTMLLYENVIETSVPFYAIDGSAGAPSYAFGSSTNTGIYSSNDDVVRISANGTNRVSVTSAGLVINSGNINATDGTVGSPAYTFTNDGNSGMYSSGANEVSLCTDGTNRLTVDSTGLKIRSNGKLLFNNDDPDTHIGRTGADTLEFTTGGTVRLTAQNASVVSTVPILVPDGSAGAPTYSFTSDSDTGMFINASNQLGFSAGGSRRFTVQPNYVVAEASWWCNKTRNVSADETISDSDWMIICLDPGDQTLELTLPAAIILGKQFLIINPTASLVVTLLANTGHEIIGNEDDVTSFTFGNKSAIWVVGATSTRWIAFKSNYT